MPLPAALARWALVESFCRRASFAARFPEALGFSDGVGVLLALQRLTAFERRIPKCINVGAMGLLAVLLQLLQQFDDVCRQLATIGVPIKQDRDQAWRDFSGWRVNYDRVLIALAGLTMAPYALWSSDRSIYQPRRIIPRRRRTFPR